MTKSRNLNAKRHVWTEAELTTLKQRYQNEKSEDLALSMGIRLCSVYNKAFSLGLKKSDEFLKSPASGRTNGKQGEGSRFEKGHASWNKGMKGLQIGGQETQFKPGSKPANYRPIGSTRVSVDGYIEVKIAEGIHQWKLLHRENWKNSHGEYPAKGMALVFKDGNKQNCDISNLEILTRGELMDRNSFHRYPKEIALLCQMKGALQRQINKRERNCEQK